MIAATALSVTNSVSVVNVNLAEPVTAAASLVLNSPSSSLNLATVTTVGFGGHCVADPRCAGGLSMSGHTVTSATGAASSPRLGCRWNVLLS